jgi:hypothetical protein
LENAGGVRSSILDQFEYLLQIASALIALAAFKGIRLIGVTGWVIDTLETMDRITIVLVFGRFLYSVVRRAFTPSGES